MFDPLTDLKGLHRSGRQSAVRLLRAKRALQLVSSHNKKERFSLFEDRFSHNKERFLFQLVSFPLPTMIWDSEDLELLFWSMDVHWSLRKNHCNAIHCKSL